MRANRVYKRSSPEFNSRSNVRHQLSSKFTSLGDEANQITMTESVNLSPQSEDPQEVITQPNDGDSALTWGKDHQS
ncbi:unnamed protein product [Allacma fusca]|uniref:Uncharacterized protein n=1 Tax=Allacma fusca TaxID=39272 RepID=A0A8J2K3Y9_9HEXA|nr:unnamed protein product [Allacma fusca]